MKRFKIEQADLNIVSHGGLALIGQAIQRYTQLSRELDTLIPLRHGTILIKKSGKNFKFRNGERDKHTGLGKFLTFFLKWVSE
ncbi:MAG: hypothetical protein P8X74_22120 [Reinekea sp.]